MVICIILSGIWSIHCARDDIVSFHTGKKRFGPLLVRIVEAKGWWYLLLRTIRWEPLWVARLSCREVSFFVLLLVLLYKVYSFYFPFICLFIQHMFEVYIISLISLSLKNVESCCVYFNVVPWDGDQNAHCVSDCRNYIVFCMRKMG